MIRSRRGSVACWCGRWRRASISGPMGAGCGCRARRWIGGSGRTVRAGSRRWSRRRGGCRTRRRRGCWSWRSRCGASSGQHGGADPQDHRGDGGQLAVGADDPASLRGGWVAVEGRADRACTRPLRGRAAERVVDRDALHGPLIDGRRTFLFCFRRRSQPAAGRLSVGVAGGRAERLAGVASWARLTRPAESRIRGQRFTVRLRAAAARVRSARHPA